MLWQAKAGMRFRLAGGYIIGDEAPQTHLLRDTLQGIWSGLPPPSLDPATRAALLGELHDANIGAAVAGPSVHQDMMVAFFTALLGAPTSTGAGVSVWLMPAH
jgi:hypothetical protein